MTLNEYRDAAHQNAVDHKFHEDELRLGDAVKNGSTGETAEQLYETLHHVFFAKQIALLQSEAGEALEADRKHRRCTANLDTVKDEWSFKHWVKDTVEDELADVFIRLMDTCGWLGIDIEKHVKLKMKYNASREALHGKAY